MPRPLDGARHDAGEKADVQSVVKGILFRRTDLLVDVDDIAQRLEGEIAQSQDHRQLHRGYHGPLAEKTQDVGPGVREEIGVFVIKQKSAAGQYRQPEEKPPGPDVFQPRNGQTAAVGDRGGSQQHRHQLHAAGVIEIESIAAGQQPHRLERTGGKVVQHRADGQKHPEGVGEKAHLPVPGPKGIPESFPEFGIPQRNGVPEFQKAFPAGLLEKLRDGGK